VLLRDENRTRRRIIMTKFELIKNYGKFEVVVVEVIMVSPVVICVCLMKKKGFVQSIMFCKFAVKQSFP